MRTRVVDLEDPIYDDVMSKKYNSTSLSFLNEIFEVIMFNTENYCKMDYEYITHKERREGEFISLRNLRCVYGQRRTCSRALRY